VRRAATWVGQLDAGAVMRSAADCSLWGQPRLRRPAQELGGGLELHQLVSVFLIVVIQIRPRESVGWRSPH